mmetsp:Transcript_16511/g.46144  ORF Transcript_16511/g.46144 Transcript_16511/m.46144 type:complete len:99 (+) Transcript_16511:1754-2050(+)
MSCWHSYQTHIRSSIIARDPFKMVNAIQSIDRSTICLSMCLPANLPNSSSAWMMTTTTATTNSNENDAPTPSTHINHNLTYHIIHTHTTHKEKQARQT